MQIPIKKIRKIYDFDYYARNVIYLDAASLIFAGYVNINYDYMLISNMSIRCGVGIGYDTELEGPYHYYKGVTLILNYLPGKLFSKFELGIGFSYLIEEYSGSQYQGTEYIIFKKIIESKFSFAFNIGYRYQNRFGGMLFRIGLGYLGYGGGIYLSLGYIF